MRAGLLSGARNCTVEVGRYLPQCLVRIRRPRRRSAAARGKPYDVARELARDRRYVLRLGNPPVNYALQILRQDADAPGQFGLGKRLRSAT